MQMMGVHAGFGGQKFIEKTLFPNEPIELEEPHEFRDYSLKKIKVMRAKTTEYISPMKLIA